MTVPEPDGAPARNRRIRAAVGGAIAVCALVIVALLISQGGDDEPGKVKTKASKESANSNGSDQQVAEKQQTAPVEDESEPVEPPPAPTPETDSVATVPESRTLFETEVPEGWVAGDVDRLNAGRYTNTWVSPDNEAVSVLIDSQPTSEEDPSAIASAESVRAQTSQSGGYSESAFEEIDLNGIPAAKWVFDVGAERKVDYFFYDCGVGVAVLGAAPKSEFSTYEDAFAGVAESTETNCQSAETGGKEFKDNPGKAKGHFK